MRGFWRLPWRAGVLQQSLAVAYLEIRFLSALAGRWLEKAAGHGFPGRLWWSSQGGVRRQPTETMKCPAIAMDAVPIRRGESHSPVCGAGQGECRSALRYASESRMQQASSGGSLQSQSPCGFAGSVSAVLGIVPPGGVPAIIRSLIPLHPASNDSSCRARA